VVLDFLDFMWFMKNIDKTPILSSSKKIIILIIFLCKLKLSVDKEMHGRQMIYMLPVLIGGIFSKRNLNNEGNTKIYFILLTDVN